MSCDIKKILVVKYGSISEIIDSLATIKSIKKLYPEAETDYFTEEIPEILISFDKNINKIFSTKKITFAEIFKFAKKFKEQKYDVVIDLNATVKSYLLTLLIGAKRTITAEKDRDLSPAKNYFKAISEYFEGAEFIENEEIQIPQNIQDYIQTAIPTNKDFVVLSTQTAQYEEGKKYRLDKFKKLAEEIIEKYDVEVFITGTADERKALQVFENISPKIHNFAGRFNIIEYAAFLKKTKCVIGIDSTPIYIAKSLKIPTIGLFGATSAESKGFYGEKTYPLNSKHLSCIPCNKDRCRLRNEEYTPCMDDILTEDITNLIDENGLLPLKS